MAVRNWTACENVWGCFERGKNGKYEHEARGTHGDGREPDRRDFIVVATYAMGAVGAGAVAWPPIDQMNLAADTLALASTEVDVSKMVEGQAITVTWRGKPFSSVTGPPTRLRARTRPTMPTCVIPNPTRPASRSQSFSWCWVYARISAACRRPEDRRGQGRI